MFKNSCFNIQLDWTDEMQTRECVISHMQINFQNTNNLFLEVHSKSIWLKSVDPWSEWAWHFCVRATESKNMKKMKKAELRLNGVL